METKHTPEPWYMASTSNNQGLIIGEVNGANVAVTYDKKDAPRIVSCINACAEIPTEALEAGVIGEMKDALEKALDMIKATYQRGYAPDDVKHIRAVLSKLKG